MNAHVKWTSISSLSFSLSLCCIHVLLWVCARIYVSINVHGSHRSMAGWSSFAFHLLSYNSSQNPELNAWPLSSRYLLVSTFLQRLTDAHHWAQQGMWTPVIVLVRQSTDWAFSPDPMFSVPQCLLGESHLPHFCSNFYLNFPLIHLPFRGQTVHCVRVGPCWPFALNILAQLIMTPAITHLSS